MSQVQEWDWPVTPTRLRPGGTTSEEPVGETPMVADATGAQGPAVAEVTVAVDATAAVDAHDREMTEAWHWALLGLAGYLPDELVHQARTWLAAGQRLEVASAVAFALLSGQIDVGGGEIPLIREELAATASDPDLLRALDTVPLGERQPSAWEFLATDPALAGPSFALPLDRTRPTRGALDDGTPGGSLDDVDRAIIAAAADEADVIGIWRSWRLPAWATPYPPPRRVFVVTIDPHLMALAAAVTGRLQLALVAAGDLDAQVEVLPAGVDAPPYQVLARIGSALLWAREAAGEVRVARVFDDVDPVGGPAFAADRPRVDDPWLRDDLLAYLDAGQPVIGTTALMPDLLDPARGEVVPMTMRTDGHWVWTDTVSYYLEEHGLAPEPDLVRHIRLAGMPAPVDEVAQHRVLAHLLQMEHAEEDSWAVPQTAAPPDLDARPGAA
ncbi:hypothetical protein [Parafrankia sp. EUN1f]|uniref:hypothetical protein n=1 Tax=Parafrankia sp. EUN1f TaxID=102897 RepID=UPI0001C455C0|nr:hypothetical protein [Parafrankia sp. EUN1f]EFC84677.1 hypothetical protein FrEUN1fDRAFT_2232 [Parafrankia sp. EUN1f]